ncbi:hypothetical protein [Methanofollis fontis]|uniref:hypothetical protein n=1 Tax=Methanofollis fontis TaxID=2052832 RepID=UPI0013EEE488|nr:hypothetical protein [Methanofollis fontis]
MQVRVPPMIADLVVMSISAIDGVEFGNCERCPQCGGEVRPHDIKRRRFAMIEGAGGKREITVWVRRFRCVDCGALASADSPFYPDTRVGSLIVDLCLVLAEGRSMNNAARLLQSMRIVLDRGSVRNYATRQAGAVPSTELYGLRIPNSLLSIVSLTIGMVEPGTVKGAEVLVACGFPSADRATLRPLRAAEEGDQRNEQEEKEERQADGI